MPAPHPVEFRQRAVELARLRDRPVAQLAKELGSESCLRGWMHQADADTGRGDGLTSAERKETAELRREKRRLEVENEILRRAAAYFRPGHPPKMIEPVVARLHADKLPVTVACRLLGVSTSGYYAWRSGGASPRQQADEALTATIRQTHQMSRGTYGSPRVHAELRLAAGVRCGRKRVARLMRADGLQGVCRRRDRGCTIRDQHAQPSTDLVNRQFTADRPDALWVCDITQHRSQEGWVYCAVVLDVYSRRIVGWSIADHLRSELVVDALDMARLRRRPSAGQTVVHSDHLSSTRPGPSDTACAKSACSGRWAPSAIVR